MTSVKIEGVLHEFSTIPGVVEDVPEIILNLKELALKIHGDGPRKINIDFEGEGVITAGDITTDPDIEILNPDLVIATLEEGAHLQMEITVDKGRGYRPAGGTRQIPIPSAPSLWIPSLLLFPRSTIRSSTPG